MKRLVAVLAGSIGAVALASLALAPPAAAQVPPPPPELCGGLSTAASEIGGIEDTVESGAGQGLPVSPSGEIRSLAITLGCRTSSPSPDPAPSPEPPDNGGEEASAGGGGSGGGGSGGAGGGQQASLPRTGGPSLLVPAGAAVALAGALTALRRRFA